MKTYPGLPEPTVDVIIDYASSRERYGGKAEFLIASLHLCGNTGTYVDSPHHRYPAGADLAELPLERLAHLGVVVIDATGAGRAISRFPVHKKVSRLAAPHANFCAPLGP